MPADDGGLPDHAAYARLRASLRALDPALKWQERPLPGGRRFVLALDGPAPEWVFDVLADAQLFVGRFELAGLVPQSRRHALMEKITRINAVLQVGCFALDLDSGELHFRSSVHFEGENLEDHLVASVVVPATVAIERWASELVGMSRIEPTN